jgi:hypothetical protein
MNFGMEGLRYLARVAAKVYKKAAGWYAIDCESVLDKPLGDFLHICGRWPEELAELLRREPLVEVCGTRIVLLADKLFELLFARRTAPQHEQDVVQRQAIRHPAAIKSRTPAEAGTRIPGKTLQIRIVNGPGDL